VTWRSTRQPPTRCHLPAFLEDGTGEQLHYLWCNSDCLQPGNWQSINLGLGSENGRDRHRDQCAGPPRIAYADHTDGGLGYTWCDANCENRRNGSTRSSTSAADLNGLAGPLFRLPVTADCGTD